MGITANGSGRKVRIKAEAQMLLNGGIRTRQKKGETYGVKVIYIRIYSIYKYIYKERGRNKKAAELMKKKKKT